MTFTQAFNEDFVLQSLVAELVKKHNIQTIIETGTYKGQTTYYLASLVPNGKVHSTEISPTYLSEARQNLQTHGVSNVELYRGDSPILLPQILSAVQGNLFCFLDSHWLSPTPTLAELDCIKRSNIKPSVIIVHDVQVPNDDRYGFDSYSDFTYNYESLKPAFDSIYGEGNYVYSFPTAPSGANRGYIVVEVK